MSVAWILGSLSIVGGFGVVVLEGFANSMADAPSTDGPDWTPALIGAGIGAVIIGSHYVKGLHW